MRVVVKAQGREVEGGWLPCAGSVGVCRGGLDLSNRCYREENLVA